MNPLDYTQSILNIRTGGVQIIKNGKLADGYHVILGVEYLVLTIPAGLPAKFRAELA
jgi:hypothetical protein